jgi:hypothetical protein
MATTLAMDVLAQTSTFQKYIPTSAEIDFIQPKAVMVEFMFLPLEPHFGPNVPSHILGMKNERTIIWGNRLRNFSCSQRY